MTFDDLPENWPTLPLDDAPVASGVIDLCLGVRNRLSNSLLLLPCDEYDVGLSSPVLVSDVDWTAPYMERGDALEILSELPVPGFVVAVASAGRLPSRLVRGWLRSVEDELDSSGKALLAFGVADLESVEIVGGRAAHNGSLRAIA